jgi:hypothetical protein
MIIRDRYELERENAQVLNLVQAMLGGVSSNLRGVSIECWDAGVRLHFLLEYDSEEEREECDDIAFEFEALQSIGLNVEVRVVVSMDRWAQSRLPGRRVFGRKEPAVSEEGGA